jgi:hypothetical protein
MHGGLSTGPRTPAGLARSRRARWKHGRYSQQAREERRRVALEVAEINAVTRAFLATVRPIAFEYHARRRKARS